MSVKKYSAIVFDLGQVLLPFDYQIFIGSLNCHKSGLGESFIKSYIENYHIHRGFEKGIISEEEFLNIVLQWAEYQITAEQFCIYWSKIFSLNEDVITLLSELKPKYKIFLLSNTNSIHKRYGYQHYDFLKLFDKIFLSFEIGYVKPEKEIYKFVEKESEIPSNELIFIDDIDEYVQSAKQLGWDGITFTNYKNLYEQLKFRNIF